MTTKTGISVSSLRSQSAMELDSLGTVFLVWLQEHRRQLMAAGVVVLLCVLGLWFMSFRKQAMLVELNTGISDIQKGDTEKAIVHLEKVRGISAIGAFYLGEAYMKSNRKEEAKKAYEEAVALVKNEGEKSRYLQQVILVKLGDLAAQSGDTGQARQWYDEAIAIEEGPLQSEALAQAGLLVEKTQDRAAAISYYEKLIPKDERYPLTEMLRERVGK